MNKKRKIISGILITVILVSIAVFILGIQGKLKTIKKNNTLVTPTVQKSCINLDEESCRKQSLCVPLGTSQTAILPEGETESFIFEVCVPKTDDYSNCKEVVKMT